MTHASPQRWKLTIEYDGGPFSGWQRQADGILSVQQVIEDAIARLGETAPRLHVAGRTDAGVHARGQVAHVDLERPMTADELQGALNFHVRPHPVVILKVEAVDETFHARFGAVMRHYLYRINNRRAPLAIDAGHVWHLPARLDVGAMRAGAQHLLGKHDFSTFRAAACQAKGPIRSLTRFDITEDGDEISCHVSAPSFLHHQVRNMVGTLAEVGRGRWQPDEVKHALEAKDRAAGGATAPADGLYFMKVEYGSAQQVFADTDELHDDE